MLDRRFFLSLGVVVVAASAARADDVGRTVMVPMRDGVELATDIYLPAGAAKGEKCPAVLVRTPYGRGAAEEPAKLATSRGLAVIAQDVRGRGDSKGEKLPFAGSGWGERGDDGADTIKWITNRAWSNGRVGTYGPSALGIVQNFTALAAPAGLEAQWIEVAAASLYHDAAYPGGILRQEQLDGWTRGNRFPVEALELMKAHPFLDSYWRLYDTRPEARRANVPAVHSGGWYDTFVEGTLEAFRTRQEEGGPNARGRQRLIVGPWSHGGPDRPKLGELDMPPGAHPHMKQTDPIRWFSHWLGGQDKGVEDDPAVTYYVLGANEWRTAKAWPPVATSERSFFLRQSGELAGRAPEGEEPGRVFAHDPKAPCPTLGGRNLNVPAGPFDQRPVEGRNDALVWSSLPLEQPLEVLGAVRARLFVASSGKDLDVHVRLTDVLEDGRSMLVLDGARRASLRLDFERPALLTPGETVPVTVELGSIAYRFAPGHRLRVTITGSNTPRYAVFPEPFQGTLASSPERPSRLELPVAGRRFR